MDENMSTLDDIGRELINGLAEYTSAGLEAVDAQEVAFVTDSIKDIMIAKEKCVKAKYYKQIMEAMTTSTYGTDYTEEGPVIRMGRFEKIMQEYEDAEGDQAKTESLKEYMAAVSEDITGKLPGMGLADKQMIKNQLQALINRI